MENPRTPTRFLTPIVILSISSVAATGLWLAVLDFSQAWKSVLASGFVFGAGAFLARRHGQYKSGERSGASLKRTRAVFIVASIMLASQLGFAAARAGAWFGDDAERWTLQWLFVALAAAAIELLSAASDKKPDRPDPD